MASREWVITKIVGLLLGLSLLLSTGVGAANLFTSLRRDVDRNEGAIAKHEEGDVKKWDNINEQVDSLKDKNHLLEISLKEQAITFSYIRKELESLNYKIDNMEEVK